MVIINRGQLFEINDIRLCFLNTCILYVNITNTHFLLEKCENIFFFFFKTKYLFLIM